MRHVLKRLYETKTIVGKSGKNHTLHSSIDEREGECIFNTIHSNQNILHTLEVGCAFGLSSLYICLALKDRIGSEHIIIDPFQHTQWDGAGVRLLEECEINFFRLIETKSEFALPKLLEENEGYFDFIFIDGWHTFDHTLVDCFYSTRLLKVGGYLAIDDASFPSVGRVIDFISNYPCYRYYDSVGENSDPSWESVAARHIISLLPPTTRHRTLNPSIYRRINRRESLIILKKVEEDSRNWDWHDDAF